VRSSKWLRCRTVTLSLTDDGDVAFRISAKPYKYIKGALEGNDVHRDILKTALTSDEWKIGTAETLFHNAELHVTNTKQTLRDKQDSLTVVGVDVNEDNVALTAPSSSLECPPSITNAPIIFRSRELWGIAHHQPVPVIRVIVPSEKLREFDSGLT
jgi:hypothetical protein